MRYVTAILFAGFVSIPVLAQDTEVTEPPTFTPGNNEAVVYFVRPARVGGAINFYIGGHVQVHLGQLSAWRRAIGLPPA